MLMEASWKLLNFSKVSVRNFETKTSEFYYRIGSSDCNTNNLE